MEPRGSMLHSQALSQAELIQFLVLTPISLRSILILPFQLCLDLPTSFFPVILPVKTLETFLPGLDYLTI